MKLNFFNFQNDACEAFKNRRHSVIQLYFSLLDMLKHHSLEFELNCLKMTPQ